MRCGTTEFVRGDNMLQRRLENQRLGYSLIELVMTVAVASAIATMSAVLLHSLMRQQAATTRQMSLTESTQRFTVRFRQDAHRAVRAEVKQDEIVLELPNGDQIVWLHQPGAMVRTTITGSDIRNDRFDIPLEQSLKIDRQDLGDGVELLSLTFDLPVRQGDVSRNSVISTATDLQFVTNRMGTTVIAELGRDGRLIASMGRAEVAE